jgi:hypothetical protein
LAGLVETLSAVAPLTGVVCLFNLSNSIRLQALSKLARACTKTGTLKLPEWHARDEQARLENGIRKASTLALRSGLHKEALAIASAAPHQRTRFWSFRDPFYRSDVFPTVYHVALSAAVSGTPIHEKDLLPAEIIPVCARLRKRESGKSFLEKVKSAISNELRRTRQLAMRK